MSDPSRALAAEIGMAIAHAVLKTLPQARAWASDGTRVDQSARISFLHDRSGTLRCRISVAAPRPALSSQRLIVSLDTDQMELFKP